MAKRRNIGLDMNGLIRQAIWVGGLGLFAILLFSAVNRQKSSHTIYEEDITILGESGERFVRPDDIHRIIQRRFGRNLDGTPLGSLDTRELEVILEKDPFIQSADVYVDARKHLNITVQQRKPILRMMDYKGGDYYVDREGQLLPLSPNYTARVLVATGLIPSYDSTDLNVDGHILQTLFKLAITIDADPVLRALIEQIDVSTRQELTLIPKIGNHKVRLGKAERLEQKLRHLKIFYKEGLAYEGWQKYKTINLKYKGQIICECWKPADCQ